MKADWIAPERTALLVIDCQVDFGAPDGEMARRGCDMAAPQAALAKAQVLVDAARAAGTTVVFVRLITNAAAESAVIREARVRQGDDGPDLCVEGSHGADFVGPQPLATETVISKKRYSVFVHTGLAGQLHAQGIDTFRKEIVALNPSLAGRVSEIASWDDVKLLTVLVDRLKRWYRRGLLCIGDAAHAMSPVGGVGINLAVQDAVAAANILWEPLREGRVTEDVLVKVQSRRQWPTEMTQRVQLLVQKRVISNVLTQTGSLRIKRCLVRSCAA